jgi:hypothetical protein
MKSKKKIVFNLSIQDLKDLGIINKKKKRRNKKSLKKYNFGIKETRQGPNMQQPSFSNISNLQTEHIALVNKQLRHTIENPPQNNDLTMYNYQLKQLSDDQNTFQNNVKGYLKAAYNNNNYLNDNIDVIPEESSEYFYTRDNEDQLKGSFKTDEATTNDINKDLNYDDIYSNTNDTQFSYQKTNDETFGEQSNEEQQYEKSKIKKNKSPKKSYDDYLKYGEENMDTTKKQSDDLKRRVDDKKQDYYNYCIDNKIAVDKSIFKIRGLTELSKELKNIYKKN